MQIALDQLLLLLLFFYNCKNIKLHQSVSGAIFLSFHKTKEMEVTVYFNPITQLVTFPEIVKREIEHYLKQFPKTNSEFLHELTTNGYNKNNVP